MKKPSKEEENFSNQCQKAYDSVCGLLEGLPAMIVQVVILRILSDMVSPDSIDKDMEAIKNSVQSLHKMKKEEDYK